MLRAFSSIAGVFWLLICGTLILQGATNYFLVAEGPDRIHHNDSYVIAVTNSHQIAHARDLIARGPYVAGAPIVVADVAAGADGLNRDLRRADARPWSWHVSRVIAFADITAEILDGWPGALESNFSGWTNNTGGKIGFWNYTVVAELPLTPRINAIHSQGDQIELSLTNLTPPFAANIEVATNVSAPNWQIQTNFTPMTMGANILLPVSANNAFYRVRTP
jgi:hypothetical protein